MTQCRLSAVDLLSLYERGRRADSLVAKGDREATKGVAVRHVLSPEQWRRLLLEATARILRQYNPADAASRVTSSNVSC